MARKKNIKPTDTKNQQMAEGWRERIFERLEEDRRSIRGVAAAGNISPNSLLAMKARGAGCTVDSYLKIADALDVHFAKLLTGKDFIELRGDGRIDSAELRTFSAIALQDLSNPNAAPYSASLLNTDETAFVVAIDPATPIECLYDRDWGAGTFLICRRTSYARIAQLMIICVAQQYLVRRVTVQHAARGEENSVLTQNREGQVESFPASSVKTIAAVEAANVVFS